VKRSLFLVAAIAGVAAVSAGLLQRPTAENEWDWVSLADSVQPLRDHFNQNSERPRFLALLSPT
jgi:hypothetical protein